MQSSQKIFFKKKLKDIKNKATEIYHLLFKSSSHNYNRIEACKKDSTGDLVCEIRFESYYELKKFFNH